LADLVADGLPTVVMVTHQLQVEHRTGKVRRSQTDVLPQCHATNQQRFPVLFNGRDNPKIASSRGRSRPPFYARFLWRLARISLQTSPRSVQPFLQDTSVWRPHYTHTHRPR